MKTMQKIILFDSIPVEINPEERTLFMFDIDGVVCKSNFKVVDENNITQEEYELMKQNCIVTPEFKKTSTILNQMSKKMKIDIKFNTGRKENMKIVTENMFKDANLEFVNPESSIIYFPSDKKWYTDDYKLIKTDVITGEETNYDKIFYTDDNVELIDHLKEKFKNNKKILPIFYSNGELHNPRNKKTINK